MEKNEERMCKIYLPIIRGCGNLPLYKIKEKNYVDGGVLQMVRESVSKLVLQGPP